MEREENRVEEIVLFIYISERLSLPWCFIEPSKRMIECRGKFQRTDKGENGINKEEKPDAFTYCAACEYQRIHLTICCGEKKLS